MKQIASTHLVSLPMTSKGLCLMGGTVAKWIVWTCNASRETSPHAHDHDEYMIVVAGQYRLWLNECEHVLDPGDEIHIPKGTTIYGSRTAGTRTIHAFENRRAKRSNEQSGRPKPLSIRERIRSGRLNCSGSNCWASDQRLPTWQLPHPSACREHLSFYRKQGPGQ